MSTNNTSNLIAVGSRVLTGVGFVKKGEIRFIGETKFAPGEWIGIHLDTPDGKNNGTVNDVKYFDTEPMYGLFVKRAQVKLDTTVIPVVPSVSPSAKIASSTSTATSKSSIAAKDKLNELKDRRLSLTSKGLPTSVSNLPTMKGARVSIIPAPVSKPVASSVNISTTTTTSSKGKEDEHSDEYTSRVEDQSGIENHINGEDDLTIVKDSNVIDSNPIYETPVRPKKEINTTAIDKTTPPPLATISIAAVTCSETSHSPHQILVVNDTIPSLHTTNNLSGVPSNGLLDDTNHNKEVDSSSSLKEQVVIEKVDPNEHASTIFTNITTACTSSNDNLVVSNITEPASDNTLQSSEEVHPKDESSDHIPASQIPSDVSEIIVINDLEDSANNVPISDIHESANVPVLTKPPDSQAPAVVSKDAKLIEYLQTSLSKLTIDNEYLQEQLQQEKHHNEKYSKEKLELSSSIDHLNEKLDEMKSDKIDLQKEMNILKTKHTQDNNQLRKDYMKEISELKSKIFAYENAPKPVEQPVVDPTIKIRAEYEDQIQDLMNNIERLTLDKEQNALELELLEEKYLQAQIDLEEVLANQPQHPQQSINENKDDNHLPDDPPQTLQPPSDSASANAASLLKAEVEKFREALRLLNNTSTQDKLLLSKQESRLLLLESENITLQAFKKQAEEDLFILRQSVDSVSSYEEMIERLSNENIEAMEKIMEYQQTISDLEDAQELNDEIDGAQRNQIDQHVSTINTLQASIQEYEQRCINYDKQIKENMIMIDKLKQTGITLKQEVYRLSALLSNETTETKNMEQKLKELASLRTQVEVQTKELSNLHNDYMSTTIMKYKYQSMYHRMDAIFGGTSYFMEEFKQVNVETMFVSTTTTGIEACRLLNNALSILTVQVDVTEESSTPIDLFRVLREHSDGIYEGESKEQEWLVNDSVSILGQLNLLLLQVQAYCIQNTLDLFTIFSHTNTDTVMLIAPRVSQKMIDFKEVFEQVIRLSILFKNTYDELLLEYHNNIQELDVMELEDMNALEIIRSPTKVSPLKKQIAGTTSTTIDRIKKPSMKCITIGKDLNDILLNYNQIITKVMQLIKIDDLISDGVINNIKSSEVDIVDVIQNFTLLSNPTTTATTTAIATNNIDDGRTTLSSSQSNISNVLKLELTFLSISSLINVIIFQLTQQIANNNQTTGLIAMLDILKSIRNDLKYFVNNLKQKEQNNGTESITDDFIGNFQLLISCLDTSTDSLKKMGLNFKNAENKISILKLIQSFIRKLNANIISPIVTIVATVNNLPLMIYFPSVLLTNSGLISINDQELSVKMREQFQALIDKYWMLLISPHKSVELLQYSHKSPMTTAIQESGMISNSPLKDTRTITSSLPNATNNNTVVGVSCNWKERVENMKKSITLKLSSDDNNNLSSSIMNVRANTTATLVESNNSNISTSNNSLIQKEGLLLNELEIKRDELQSAMRKCNELQEKVDIYESQLHEIKTNNTTISSKDSRRNSIIPSNDHSDANNNNHSEELYNEIKTLEEALKATETRADSLEQETKLLKAKLTMQGLIQSTTNNNTTNNNNVLQANKGKANNTIQRNVQQTNTNTLIGKPSNDKQLYELILEENNYWKGLILKRSCQNLIPLSIKTDPNSHMEYNEKYKFNKNIYLDELILNLQTKDKKEEIVKDHKQMISNDDDNNLNQYKHKYISLYHELRLTRAKNIHVKSMKISRIFDKPNQQS